MRFEEPLLLLAAPAIALVVALLAWLARRARVRTAGRWSAALGAEARRLGRGSVALLGLVALAAAVAAAGPRFGRAQVDVESRALNLVLAVDISRSMLAEDAPPNRLDRSVREARRVMQDAEGDRIGLIAFAGRSYILAPLTLDASAVRLYLDHLDPDIASEGGTDLGAMLRQGGELLAAAAQGGDRVLVVFTDGEGHDSLPLAAAAAARLRAAGVSLILVAQGSEGGAPIPVRDSLGRLVGNQRDGDGMVIETRRRDDYLRAVATAAGGTLIRADLQDQAGAVRGVLTSLERRPARERRVDDLIPRAWMAALLAFGGLLVHSVTRRSAALAGLGLVVATATAAAQRPSEGVRLLRRGDSAAATGAFRQAAQARVTSDTAWYNFGTAALLAGQLDEARAALVTAARSVDPGLRFQALYNLGLASLRAARADSAGAGLLLSEAGGHFREALLLRPGSAEAKWNLELTNRLRPPPTPRGGGGTQPPSQGGGVPPPPAAHSGALTPEEAERILASVEQGEQAVRADQVRRRRGLLARSGRDW